MAIHWYKSALIITTIIHGTACLSADNDSPMTGPYGGKRKFTAIEDGSPLPSAKRQRVITPYDEKERNILIEKIAKRLINFDEVKGDNRVGAAYTIP